MNDQILSLLKQYAKAANGGSNETVLFVCTLPTEIGCKIISHENKEGKKWQTALLTVNNESFFVDVRGPLAQFTAPTFKVVSGKFNDKEYTKCILC